MKFDRELVPGLPPLAWLFQAKPEGRGKLLHGSAVWVHDEGFVEGCLAARGDEDPRDATDVFGSALSTRGNRWLFVTPSHTLEGLYLYRNARGWSISNSLAFLTAYHRLVPPWDPRYGATFASLCFGIDDYQKTLWRTAEGEIVRLVYDNVELTPNGDFLLTRKPLPPPFRSFEAYVEHLRETLGLAFANAVSPARSAAYHPLATCSTGYDSASVAALAAPLGCRQALTLRTSRDGQSDSGKPVGELLGLNVSEVDRPERVEGSFEELAEFVSTGMGGEDYCFKGFGPHLDGRMLLTGFHGGRIWGSKAPSAVLPGNDLSGSSLQEFRLWKNFIHIPVPMIGAQRHPEIAAISRGPEMAAYRLNNGYDRPIARRILEEAGVPRSLFGQHKRAASVLLFRDSRLLDSVNRRECEAAVPRQWVWAAKYTPARASWEVRLRAYLLLNRYRRRSQISRRLQRALVGDWRIFEHSSPWAALEFIAGLLVVAHRYQKVLQGRSSRA